MRTHRKPTKIIIKILIVILLCWIIIFSIDYHKSTNLEKPLFIVPVETADDGGSGTYKGLGYTIDLEVELVEGKAHIISVTMYMFGKVIAGSIT